MKQIKFRAPDDLLDQLRDASETSGVPQATIIRNAVTAELTRQVELANRIKTIQEIKK